MPFLLIGSLIVGLLVVNSIAKAPATATAPATAPSGTASNTVQQPAPSTLTEVVGSIFQGASSTVESLISPTVESMPATFSGTPAYVVPARKFGPSYFPANIPTSEGGGSNWAQSLNGLNFRLGLKAPPAATLKVNRGRVPAVNGTIGGIGSTTQVRGRIPRGAAAGNAPGQYGVNSRGISPGAGVSVGKG